MAIKYLLVLSRSQRGNLKTNSFSFSLYSEKLRNAFFKIVKPKERVKMCWNMVFNQFCLIRILFGSIKTWTLGSLHFKAIVFPNIYRNTRTHIFRICECASKAHCCLNIFLCSNSRLVPSVLSTSLFIFPILCCHSFYQLSASSSSIWYRIWNWWKALKLRNIQQVKP